MLINKIFSKFCHILETFCRLFNFLLFFLSLVKMTRFVFWTRELTLTHGESQVFCAKQMTFKKPFLFLLYNSNLPRHSAKRHSENDVEGKLSIFFPSFAQLFQKSSRNGIDQKEKKMNHKCFESVVQFDLPGEFRFH